MNVVNYAAIFAPKLVKLERCLTGKHAFRVPKHQFCYRRIRASARCADICRRLTSGASGCSECSVERGHFDE